jgi:hypothetical protein
MGLAVFVDGSAMPEPDARAFWARFSAWMEEHRGDLAGFAANEGFASVHPGVENGLPVLYASRSAGQQPYGPVARGGAGGSDRRHEPGNRGSGPRRKSNKPGRNRRA